MGSGFDVDVGKGQIGIIPRAIHQLFDSVDSRIQHARENGLVAPEFKITAQFMELYNEEVIDLFNPGYSKVSNRSRKSSHRFFYQVYLFNP